MTFAMPADSAGLPQALQTKFATKTKLWLTSVKAPVAKRL